MEARPDLSRLSDEELDVLESIRPANPGQARAAFQLAGVSWASSEYSSHEHQPFDRVEFAGRIRGGRQPSCVAAGYRAAGGSIPRCT